MRKEEGMQQTGFKLDSRKNLLPTKIISREGHVGGGHCWSFSRGAELLSLEAGLT